MPDQYTRTRAQLGTPALDALRKAHVAVFGIGGVGGQAVEVLARSGVGELSLFDSDIVALSNLNASWWRCTPRLVNTKWTLWPPALRISTPPSSYTLTGCFITPKQPPMLT